MANKKLSLQLSAVAVLIALYCLWSIVDINLKLDDTVHNIEDLQRKVHIMHGADLLEAKEKQDRESEEVFHQPARATSTVTKKYDQVEHQSKHVQVGYQSKHFPVPAEAAEGLPRMEEATHEKLINVDLKADIEHLYDQTISNRTATKKNGTGLSLDLLDPDSYLPLLDGENVISMSVWGSDRRYTNGVLRNAEIIKEFFPGWKLRIYTPTPNDHARIPLLPTDIIQDLRKSGAGIEYIDSSNTVIPPMMWRFLVADDLSVDRFLVRDADSRLSGRDAAAVAAWEDSGMPLQCVRDHPSHSAYALSGGLWGGKPALLQNILRRSWEDLMYGYRNEYLQDMAFLNDIIWPKFNKNHVYCSDSFSCDKWPGSHPFPIRRLGYEHVGQVYGPNEMFRPDDVAILRKVGENPTCTPS